MNSTVIISNVVSFFAGAYVGILAYRTQLARYNKKNKIEIYVDKKVP